MSVVSSLKRVPAPLRQIDKAVLALIPLVLMGLNDVWLSDRLGDIDTWFYYGHFRHLAAFKNVSTSITNDYYETRLPLTLFGAAFHTLLSDGLARVAFNLVLLYGTVIFSLFYVVQFHANRLVAFLTTCLLAADIYFLRSIAWDYVDCAVMAYQALTFAFLTLAVGGGRRPLWNVAAGFSATSMIFVHLGSVILFPVFLAYLLYLSFTAVPAARRYRYIGYASLWVMLGIGAAQLVYGLANKFLLGQDFLFLALQIMLAKVPNPATLWPYAWLAPPQMAKSAYWLTIHCAVMLAGVASLILGLRQAKDRRRFDLFCALLAVAFYGAVLASDLTGSSVFLGRDGLYATFFTFTTYLCLAAFMARVVDLRWRDVIFCAVIFLAATALRLSIKDGLGLASYWPVPMYCLALVMAVALAMIWFFRTRLVFLVAMSVFAGASLFVSWPFERDDSVTATHAALLARTDGRLPVFFYRAEDPLTRKVFVSIVASFTERAWFQHGSDYPKFIDWRSKVIIRPGDFVVVLSSTEERADAARQSLENYAEGRSAGSFDMKGANGTFHVHCFEIISVKS